MKGLTQYPEEYAQHRIRETTQDTGRDQELYEGYMDYYRSRNVQSHPRRLIVHATASREELGAHRRGA